MLTEHSGVVIVKATRKTFILFHESTENSDSYWKRGTKLIISGYKSGASFQTRATRNYKGSVIKIEKINGRYAYETEKR